MGNIVYYSLGGVVDDALMHTLVKNAQVQTFISCTKSVQNKIPDNMHISITYSNTPQSFIEILQVV